MSVVVMLAGARGVSIERDARGVEVRPERMTRFDLGGEFGSCDVRMVNHSLLRT